MKRILTTTTVLPLVLAGFLAFVARGDILNLLTGQSVTSPTNVSLTVVATSSASSAASSSSSAASSAATSSASSSDGERPPYGRYHYSEELTMERLIPLLHKRFTRPSAPIVPEEIIPPYYRPITTFPRTRVPSEHDLLRFGRGLQSDMESFLTWPWGAPEPETDDLHFMPWGPFDAWQWQVTPLSPEDTDEDMHAAAGTEQWQWVRYIISLVGPRGEPWIWGFFFMTVITLIAFWRRLTDKTVNLLIFMHKQTKRELGCYEGPPLHF